MCEALGIDIHGNHVIGINLDLHAEGIASVSVTYVVVNADTDAFKRILRNYRLTEEAQDEE